MDLFHFVDPVDFLEKQFEAQKNVRQKFSVKDWAREMGFNNPDLLIDIFKRKKNINHQLISVFTQYFKFDSNEEKYFEVLVFISRASSNREIEIFHNLLSEYRALARIESNHKEDEQIFASWLPSGIVTAMGMEGFQCSTGNLKNLFNNRFSYAEIQSSLDQLMEMNVIIFENGSYIKSVSEVRTKNDVSSRVVHNYYDYVSNLAKEAKHLPVTEREFQCFSVAIDKDDLPVFKEMMRDLRAKFSSRSANSNNNQIFQMNMQLFPVSEVQALDQESSNHLPAEA